MIRSIKHTRPLTQNGRVYFFEESYDRGFAYLASRRLIASSIFLIHKEDNKAALLFGDTPSLPASNIAKLFV